VDLARSSDDTLLSAIDVARVFNAELDVLHVTPPTQSYPGMPHLTGVIDIYGFGTIGPEQAEPAVPDIPPEENLEHFLGRFDKSGIQVTPLIRSGESAETIRETVAERSADMLVVGSANWDNQHVVLGGTITRLLRHVPCELLLVKHRRPTDD
jgi:nucleotide-binding universal stress UspA family protein